MEGDPRLYFVVDGDPVGFQRMRLSQQGGQHHFEPAKPRRYKQQIATEFMRATGHGVLIPPAVSIKIRCLFRNGTHPDPDNVLKLALDSLTGLAYKNDRHIASTVTHEYDANRPRIEITLY